MNELYHFGILGMRWGVRRYQNKDGTLTPAGRRRANRISKKYIDENNKALADINKTYASRAVEAHNYMADKINAKYANKKVIEGTKLYEKWMKESDDLYIKKYNELTINELRNNEHIKKARAIVEKYGEHMLNEETLSTYKENEEILRNGFRRG